MQEKNKLESTKMEYHLLHMSMRRLEQGSLKHHDARILPGHNSVRADPHRYKSTLALRSAQIMNILTCQRLVHSLATLPTADESAIDM